MTRGPETWITELTPLSFLARSAGVYPDKTAIVHGAQRWTYAEFARDAQRLARGLRASGVRPGPSTQAWSSSSLARSMSPAVAAASTCSHSC